MLTNHVTYVLLGAGILLLDAAGPTGLSFPILFVVPVGLSAWYCSARFAYLLAAALAAGRLWIAMATETQFSPAVYFANAIIRVVVLALLAYLVARIVRQQKEIAMLTGILPICMHCRRIREGDSTWEAMEVYVSRHSEAQFSHGICPECLQKYYPDFASHRGTEP